MPIQARLRIEAVYAGGEKGSGNHNRLHAIPSANKNVNSHPRGTRKTQKGHTKVALSLATTAKFAGRLTSETPINNPSGTPMIPIRQGKIAKQIALTEASSIIVILYCRSYPKEKRVYARVVFQWRSNMFSSKRAVT